MRNTLQKPPSQADQRPRWALLPVLGLFGAGAAWFTEDLSAAQALLWAAIIGVTAAFVVVVIRKLWQKHR